MTEVLLIVLMLVLLGLYAAVRPSWGRAGPFLPDAYLISVGLYTLGALIVEWTNIHVHADVLAFMSMTAMLTSTAGAILFCLVFRAVYANADFKHIHEQSRIGSRETWIINILIIASAAVCFYFFYLILTSNILSQFFMLANILEHSTLSSGRLAIASGSAGYMAPGYIMQFRDTVLPLVLCTMLLLYPRPLKTVYFWAIMVLVIVAMLVTAQRGNLVLLTLTIATASYYANAVKNVHAPRKLSITSLVLVASAIIIPFAILSTALGRSDADSSASAVPFQAIADFFDRIVVTVPRENTQTYDVWSAMGPTYGGYWAGELSTIWHKGFHGQSAYFYLSNVLHVAIGGSPQGNSGLGLPADIWFNWGWMGLFIVPVLYAIFFGLIDLVLLSERSALFFALKIYLFFVMPNCSIGPYQFLLYGGAVSIVLIVYVKVASALRSYLAVKYARAASV